MVFDKLFAMFGMRGPIGLSVELGMESDRLARRGLMVRGSGPYMKMHDGGYCWKKRSRRAFILPATEANPHMLISGMSGFGKSMFFKSVLVDVARAGASCIIFDGHNEHREVVKGLGGQCYDAWKGGINLLSLDGATVSDRIAGLTGLLSNVYRLGQIQSTKLGQCLRYTYRRFGARGGNDRKLDREPKVSDLLFEIQVFIGNAKTASEKATLLNLQSKISNLNGPAFNSEAAWNLKQGIHSFSVSERMSREARLIYLVELLERIYAGMKDDTADRRIRQYIMIDESQVLINESEECSGVITKFIEEGRKYGRGVIIVTHMSSRLNRQIVANAATFMAFYSREPSEAAYVAKVMASNFDAEQAVRSRLATLGDGEAMVISANHRTPRVVATVDLRRKIEIYKASEENGLSDFADRPIKIEDLSRKVGITVDQVREQVGGMLASFTLGADEWVMKKRSNPGVEHEVMVEKIQSVLLAAGVKSYIYDRACGPDLVAYSGADRVAIEYETGSKVIHDSVRMVRKRLWKYQRVVVVVNDRVLAKYKELLSKVNCTVIGVAEIDRIPSLCAVQEAGRASAEADIKVT